MADHWLYEKSGCKKQETEELLQEIVLSVSFPFEVNYSLDEFSLIDAFISYTFQNFDEFAWFAQLDFFRSESFWEGYCKILNQAATLEMIRKSLL
jgi:hypothetical protein